MLRTLLLLIFLPTFLPGLQAQWLKEKVELWQEKREARIALIDRYQIAGPVLSWSNVQDTRMSPLIYDGPGGGGYWSTLKQKSQWTEITSFSFRYNLLNGPTEILEGTYINPAASFETVFLRKLADPRWQAGGSISVFYQARFYDKLENDASNHDFISSIGFDLLFEQAFRFRGRDAWISSRLQAPVFSYLFRIPDYNISGLSHIWAPPWQFQKLSLETSLIRKMKYSLENRWSVGYVWDFYHLNEPEYGHAVYYGVHSLRLGLWLKDR